MATVPYQPGAFRILQYFSATVEGDAAPNALGNGGSPILQWQLGYHYEPTAPIAFVNLSTSTGWGTVEGLTPGQTYYFWNRQRNAQGWSAWSPRSSVTMRDRPDRPLAPVTLARAQTSITIKITPTYNGGDPITFYRIRYGLSPDAPTNTQTSVSPTITLTGLSPGRMYYFWAQAANSYGESFYSPRYSNYLVAGALVKVGLVWKRAVPYVKVGGVWKVARPWARLQGSWFETTDGG